MSSTIMETTATWMPVAHPAASPHVSGGRQLPVSPRLRAEVCPQVGGARVTGASGSGLAGGGSAGRTALRPRDAVSGGSDTGLPGYRSVHIVPIAEAISTSTSILTSRSDSAPTAGFASVAPQQGAFLAGTGDPTTPMTALPTTTVPTTTVRNEKQEHPGPSVLRPPL